MLRPATNSIISRRRSSSPGYSSRLTRALSSPVVVVSPAVDGTLAATSRAASMNAHTFSALMRSSGMVPPFSTRERENPLGRSLRARRAVSLGWKTPTRRIILLSMATERAYKLLTVEEFFDACPNDQRHYQLIDGVIVAMAPPAIPHQIIAGNLTGEIY